MSIRYRLGSRNKDLSAYGRSMSTHSLFYQGWTIATPRASRDIYFQSAIANLICLAQFFADWFSSESSSSAQLDGARRDLNLYASLTVPTMPVTMIWYHIFWSIRCALLIHQHMHLSKEAEESSHLQDPDQEQNLEPIDIRVILLEISNLKSPEHFEILKSKKRLK